MSNTIRAIDLTLNFLQSLVGEASMLQILVEARRRHMTSNILVNIGSGNGKQMPKYVIWIIVNFSTYQSQYKIWKEKDFQMSSAEWHFLHVKGCRRTTKYASAGVDHAESLLGLQIP